MKPYFSIGEAAKAAHTTSETLRHNDRIGLVKPSQKEEWTKSRYYNEKEQHRMTPVRAYTTTELALQSTKAVLEKVEL